MKFDELPKELQDKFVSVSNHKKLVLITTIIWCSFFFILTLVCFKIKNGFEYFSVITIICILLGLYCLFCEYRHPEKGTANEKKFIQDNMEFTLTKDSPYYEESLKNTNKRDNS